MTWGSVCALATSCATLLAGCGTAGSYSPQQPGRIHIVKTESGRALQKNGTIYSMSWLSSDPVRIVAGDPVAEEHARTYVARPWWGAALVLAGAALYVPAAALATGEPGHTGRKVGSVVIASTAGVTMIVGILLAASSRHHLYDAINVYNDDVALGSAGEAAR